MSHNSNKSKVRVVAYNYNENENMMSNEVEIDLSKKDKNIKYNNRRTDLVEIDPILESEHIVPENNVFIEMLHKEVLVIMSAHQLNILGQTFRPIFCGTVADVTNGFITLNPAIVKMSNAPFFRFPTPLSFPMENITYFLPFDCNVPFPIS